MLRRLARTKKLNNKKLRVLLVPAVEHLDLENVFLTPNILKIIYHQCQQLKSLSLRNCSYIITDNVLTQLCKVVFLYILDTVQVISKLQSSLKQKCLSKPTVVNILCYFYNQAVSPYLGVKYFIRNICF